MIIEIEENNEVMRNSLSLQIIRFQSNTEQQKSQIHTQSGFSHSV
jgi:hypothetical protein